MAWGGTLPFWHIGDSPTFIPVGHLACAGWHEPFPAAPKTFEETPKAAWDAQARLDASCDGWAGVNMHLLLFSWAQLMVVLGNVKLHNTGELQGVPYTWYWLLQDIFHMGWFVLVPKSVPFHETCPAHIVY